MKRKNTKDAGDTADEGSVWEKFEHTVDKLLDAPPMHKKAGKTKAPAKAQTKK